MDKLILEGKDNYGKPRQNFADKLASLTDEEFIDVAKDTIWLSAYAGNNPRSDYHWQADACHNEAKRRGKPMLYQKAWNKAVRSAGYDHMVQEEDEE